MKVFYHNMKYFIISRLKSKDIVFWTLMFPIILGSFFKMAFSRIYDDMTNMDPIPVAVVEESRNDTFRAVLDSMEQSGNKLFDVRYADEKEALKNLENGDVKGIIYSGEKLSVAVSQNDIEQTVLKEFAEDYNIRSQIIADIAVKDPSRIQAAAGALSEECRIENLSLTNGNSDPNTQYFYNLIAMTALFGTLVGIQVSVKDQANLSALGARKCCSPVPGSVRLASALIGCFILQTLCMIVCVTFIVLVLKIDMGGRLPLVYMAAVLGGITGNSMGFFVGSIGKIDENKKSIICTAVVMLFCFLSGLMIGDIKADIEEKIPLLNDINPAAVISDSLYCLNIYSDYREFIVKIATMLVMTAVFTALGIIMTRRRKYASL